MKACAAAAQERAVGAIGAKIHSKCIYACTAERPDSNLSKKVAPKHSRALPHFAEVWCVPSDVVAAHAAPTSPTGASTPGTETIARAVSLLPPPLIAKARECLLWIRRAGETSASAPLMVQHEATSSSSSLTFITLL